jgi:hypothetical protein
MRTFWIALALALILPAMPAKAWRTVQELYEDCTAADETSQLVCLHYISGVGDMMAYNANEKTSTAMACFPAERGKLGVGAAVQAFKNYAAQHPEFWGTPAVFAVIEALREAWPCR